MSVMGDLSPTTACFRVGDDREWAAWVGTAVFFRSGPDLMRESIMISHFFDLRWWSHPRVTKSLQRNPFLRWPWKLERRVVVRQHSIGMTPCHHTP